MRRFIIAVAAAALLTTSGLVAASSAFAARPGQPPEITPTTLYIPDLDRATALPTTAVTANMQ
jgi:hypothetical protein